jgi:type III pantothenate kinase
MLLAIDVGNTNTVLGAFEDGKLYRSWRVKTDPRDTADELWLQYRALLDDIEIDGLSICSTVPASLREIRQMISIYFSDIPVVIVEPGIRTGVPLLVDNPKEIGADRIVNTLAAHTLFGSSGPCIVVDFGTSTNLDVVSPRGEFLGGALAPGIEISVDALAARAAQLRKVELVKPKSVIGKNTVEALQSGTIYGFAGQVDGLVTRIIEELEQLYPGTGSTTVVATGGLAPLVVGISETIDSHEPDLTLLGLGMIFDRNTVSDLDEAEPTEPTQVVEPAESAEVVEPDNPMVDQAPTADI